MVFNELLFSSLGLLNEIADEPLTFQQMYLELNSILVLTNRPKVDRDSFLIYLSINGYISLRGIGEQKLTLGNLSIKNHLNVHEAYIKSSYGVSYYTLLFAKEVRLEIYRIRLGSILILLTIFLYEVQNYLLKKPLYFQKWFQKICV